METLAVTVYHKNIVSWQQETGTKIQFSEPGFGFPDIGSLNAALVALVFNSST